MPPGDAIVIETLPSAVAGVRRMLLRLDGSGIVEAFEAPPERLAGLPADGLFAPFQLQGGRAVLGPPLQRRLVDLRPPPLVVLGLVQRLLEDLDVLHREGGAHGALGLDGIGVDEFGALRVRPVFSVAQNHTQLADVAAVGSILAALADRERLLATGLARAPFLLSGLGVGAARPGFTDARSARQALAVITRGLKVEEARDQFLAALGAHLPPAPRQFRVRPVMPGAPVGRDARVNEARAWLDRSLGDVRSARFDRESRLADETTRLTHELQRQTEATILAARAVAEREAESLVQRTAAPPPAMLFVGAGVRPGALPPRFTPLPVETEEDTLDAASADGAYLAGFGDGTFIESFAAPDGGDSRVTMNEGGPPSDPDVASPASEAIVAPGTDGLEPAPTPEDDEPPLSLDDPEEATEATEGEDEARIAAEAERAAAEARAAEEARIAAEAERAATEARAAEEARIAAEAERAAAEARAAEEARITAEAERAAAEARAAEEARIAAEAERAAAEARAAEEARIAAEAERAAAEARAAEEARIAAEAERAAAEARAAEEARIAAEAERAAAEARAAEEARIAAPAAPVPAAPRPPTSPPAVPAPYLPPDVEDHPEAAGPPRWEGLGGVTGDPSRMNEKGPGKWTQQGRSREELAEQLPPGESRPLDLSAPPSPMAGRWPLVIGALLVVGLLLAWALS